MTRDEKYAINYTVNRLIAEDMENLWCKELWLGNVLTVGVNISTRMDVQYVNVVDSIRTLGINYGIGFG